MSMNRETDSTLEDEMKSPMMINFQSDDQKLILNKKRDEMMKRLQTRDQQREKHFSQSHLSNNEILAKSPNVIVNKKKVSTLKRSISKDKMDEKHETSTLIKKGSTKKRGDSVAKKVDNKDSTNNKDIEHRSTMNKDRQNYLNEINLKNNKLN